MLAIGILVSTETINCTIYNSKTKNISFLGEIRIPSENFMQKGKSLRFLRHSIIDIVNNTLEENLEIKIVGLRMIEKGSQNINRERIEMEGVVKEALASSKAKKSYLIYKKEMADETDIKYQTFHNIYTKKINEEDDFKLNNIIKNWKNATNRNIKESAIVAFTAYSMYKKGF